MKVLIFFVPLAGICIDGESVLIKKYFGWFRQRDRVTGRISIEKMTSSSELKPTYCWGNKGDIVDFGIGFNRCRRPMFTFSENTFWHEGSGACAMYIDPKEEMVAVWITPFATEGWHGRIMFNTINVIWSGII